MSAMRLVSCLANLTPTEGLREPSEAPTFEWRDDSCEKRAATSGSDDLRMAATSSGEMSSTDLCSQPSAP